MIVIYNVYSCRESVDRVYIKTTSGSRETSVLKSRCGVASGRPLESGTVKITSGCLSSKKYKVCTGVACGDSAAPSPDPICFDSDGGPDFYVFGTTTLRAGSVLLQGEIDRCVTTSTLTEYFCNGAAIVSASTVCGRFCSGGQCNR